MRAMLALGFALALAGCGGNNAVSVTVTPATSHVAVGASEVLAAEALDGKKMKVSTTFQWTSDKPAIATVDGSGKVTGVADGMANITAQSSNGVKGSAVVQVGTGGGNVLTITTTGTGQGTVTSSPAGIDCGSSCVWGFPAGTMVTLTPTPSSGSYFRGWTGACSGTGPCMLTMDQDQQATAEFDKGAGPTLTVVTMGSGTGTITSSPAGIDCSSGAATGCSAVFPSGTQVTLSASAATGTFIGWTGGGCAGNGSCALTLTADTQVTATIAKTRTLAVTLAGDGSGTVTSTPAGINCTSGSTTGCSFDFPDTIAMVTLAAAPANGSSWGGWSAPCSTDTSCMLAPGMSVTASFSSWSVHVAMPGRLQDLAQLGTTYIAVGSDGLVATATTPGVWTGRAVPTQAILHGVAANAGGLAVAVGDGGTILTSTNGTMWSAVSSGVTTNLQSVSYGAFSGGSTGFVAVGAGGLVLRSSDGMSWVKGTSGTSNDLSHVTNGGGIFVAVGSLGTIITSSDGGATFAAQSSGTTQALNGVSFGSGKFVAVGNGATEVQSTNAGFTAWSASSVAQSPNGDNLLAVTFGSGNVFAASVDAIKPPFLYGDGTTWTAANAVTQNERQIGMSGSFFGLGEFGSIVTAADAITWAYSLPPRTAQVSTDLLGVAFGKSTLVAVGKYGAIFTSADGVTWTSQKSVSAPVATDVNSAVAFGNNVFAAAGGTATNARVIVSADGATWNALSNAGSFPQGALQSLVYDGTKGFIGVGYQFSGGMINPLVVTSSTGAANGWSIGPGTNLSGALNSVACDGTNVVATSDTGIFTTTTPGGSWTANTSAGTLAAINGDTLGPLAFGAVGNNKTFVLLDVSHPEVSIVSSDGGVTWTRNTAGQALFNKNGRNGIVFGNGKFMTNTLAQSTDGVTWTQGTLPANSDVLGAVYATGIGWVTVGSQEKTLMHP